MREHSSMHALGLPASGQVSNAIMQEAGEHFGLSGFVQHGTQMSQQKAACIHSTSSPTARMRVVRMCNLAAHSKCLHFGAATHKQSMARSQHADNIDMERLQRCTPSWNAAAVWEAGTRHQHRAGIVAHARPSALSTVKLKLDGKGPACLHALSLMLAAMLLQAGKAAAAVGVFG